MAPRTIFTNSKGGGILTKIIITVSILQPIPTIMLQSESNMGDSWIYKQEDQNFLNKAAGIQICQDINVNISIRLHTQKRYNTLLNEK